MTRARVTAQQAARPPKAARLIRGTVSAVLPLTVQIAGGGAVRGLALPAQVYTVGDAVLVAVQEPAVGAVYPLTATPPADLTPYAKTSDLTPYAKTADLAPYATTTAVAAGYLPKSALASIPTITNLDTAPDGFAFAAVANNPLGAGVLVETFSTSLGGTPWRLQRITDETRGATQSRSSWAGTWGPWAGASTGLPTLTAMDTAPDGQAVATSSTTGNPFGTVTAFVETRSATLGGSPWRFQRASHETNGTVRSRRSFQGSWSAWAAASTA